MMTLGSVFNLGFQAATRRQPQVQTRTVVDRAGYRLAANADHFKNAWKARALEAERDLDDKIEQIDDLEDDVENLEAMVQRLRAENAELKSAQRIH
ncbi:hypothetical protein [Roseovarius atlanticus]|uniref:hypothetical protein n=1 Tax=Roseovarius atlanticus TaxID=1641875 RepID=UPI000AA7F0E2|nr:hypothetical protein [Roseovarius atlanticus]